MASDAYDHRIQIVAALADPSIGRGIPRRANHFHEYRVRGVCAYGAMKIDRVVAIAGGHFEAEARIKSRYHLIAAGWNVSGYHPLNLCLGCFLEKRVQQALFDAAFHHAARLEPRVDLPI